MQLKRTAATATMMGALSVATAGFGTGWAQAEPSVTTPTPMPAPSVTTPTPMPTPSVVDGSGGGVGAPGDPAAPGRDFLPPPGRSGPVPPDAVVPMWAPPAPPPPWWAPWLPVVWNTDLNAWGVWWNGTFQRLP